jgi:hypothetical protein
MSALIGIVSPLSSLESQDADDPAPHFTASALLIPSVARGPHHQVDEEVRTDGYFHEFTISSTFGSFQAVGRTQLAVRIQEIEALAALQDVSKTEVFLAAAGQSVVKIGQGAAAAVSDPAATVKGLGAGIKRFGVNLGRRTQRAATSAADTGDTGDSQTKDSGTAGKSAAQSVLGVSAAMRRWAQKVGADPYTTNVVLQKALEDIARVDAAGSIATRVAVPIPAVVGMTASVGGLVWGQDPEEVRKVNERGLRVLAVPDAVAKDLFRNQWFTLTYQTRLIAALGAVNVSGVADYVKTAADAGNEREALFFVESAEMLQHWHAQEPVTSVLTDSRALVAKGPGGRARALLPLDWISWTTATHTALREIGARARRELGATRLEMVMTGRASDRALREIAGLGWTVVPRPTTVAAGVPSNGVEPEIVATVRDLARTIESQQRLIEVQARQIEELRREMVTIRTLTQAAQKVPDRTSHTLAAVQARAGQPDVEQTPSRVPELPPDVVSAGDFPGSFKVPGSNAALKIGGLVRVNWVSTYDALLVDDRFQTSAIPVRGTVDAERGGRVNVIAGPSRFNFDLRTPTGVGHMRAFIEGDFAADRNTLRLRHAYGQWRRFIYGQTWSTFSDPEAEPDGIDFEGLNAIVLFRQPQIRWSFPLGDRFRMALALEDPRPDLTGATGVNQIPDVVVRVRWEPRLGGHVQLSGITRQLRGEPTNSPNEIVAASGYGINVSGRLPFPFWGERDQLLFQHNGGRGLGRYIADLGSLGGQDGIFDPTAHTLRLLDVFSGYVGYEHWWNERLRSSISFGIVSVNNVDVQPDDAMHLTRRSTVNFMWSPIPRLDLVTEFLWGRRVNKDGRSGFAAQTQIGSTFRF